MIPSEENVTCQNCGLFNGCRHPFMPFSGPKDAKLLIIGEAPGKNEDQIGRQFVGESGLLLREALEAVGYDIETEVAFTNIVRCRPPDNKTTQPVYNQSVRKPTSRARKTPSSMARSRIITGSSSMSTNMSIVQTMEIRRLMCPGISCADSRPVLWRGVPR